MSLGVSGESTDGSSGRGSANHDGEAPRCSAKACRLAATTELRWRNPRLHDASRLKTWMACDDHADHLDDFLARRGFLLGRGPLEADPSVDGSTSS